MKLPRKMSAQNVMASISRTFASDERKDNEIRFACDERKDNEIRFAGEERRDKLYEPKHKQILVVRVLTVVAYVIFVSMTAILLSLYYTFLWDPKDVSIRMRMKPECISIKLPNAHTTPIMNETQIEEMTTKSLSVTKEHSPLPENTTSTYRPKDLLSILVQSANATSSTSPITTFEDLQIDSSTEETSTKILTSDVI